MKLINTLVISCLAIYSFAQTTITANGRSYTFNKKADYSSGDWSRSTTTYQDINNDSIYIGYIDNDDNYGVSYSLKAYYVYDYLPSSMKKPASKQDFILKERKLDSYGGHSIVTFSFENEEKFLAFYNKLIGSLNTDYKQKIADAEKGINDPEEQVAKNTLLEQQNAAASQQKKADEQAKTVYEENYYAFDLAHHGVENQFVILSNDKGEECMRVDRLKNEYFRNVNGTWVSKAGVIKNNTQLENYDEIMRTYGKKDTLGVWTLQDDGFNVVQYTETGGIFKYRYFPTKELIKDFDELVGTSNSINYRYDPQTGQIIHFDSKTVYFTVSGGKPSMDELLIMIYLYKSPLFK